jgi:hypothetical protein
MITITVEQRIVAETEAEWQQCKLRLLQIQPIPTPALDDETRTASLTIEQHVDEL